MKIVPYYQCYELHHISELTMGKVLNHKVVDWRGEPIYLDAFTNAFTHWIETYENDAYSIVLLTQRELSTCYKVVSEESPCQSTNS